MSIWSLEVNASVRVAEEFAPPSVVLGVASSVMRQEDVLRSPSCMDVRVGGRGRRGSVARSGVDTHFTWRPAPPRDSSDSASRVWSPYKAIGSVGAKVTGPLLLLHRLMLEASQPPMVCLASAVILDRLSLKPPVAWT